MSDHLTSVALIGCGYMGREYAKVLQGLGADFCVVGRGEASARAFEKEIGISPFVGGLSAYLKTNPVPDAAIVAVSLEQAYETAVTLMEAGVRQILLEKPGAVTYEEISNLASLAKARECKVSIAYNRRFYSSALQAKALIEADGGVSSFRFEFTEWSHKIEALDKDPSTLSHWFLANSTHVVDLAFFLGGKPKQMESFTAGALSWYPNASSFSGAGITESGAPFSYYADWESAGRWDVEILTKKRKLILCPLEGLKMQLRGSIAVEDVALEDELDRQFKPGLYLQTQAFLRRQFDSLLSLQEHNDNCALYRKIEQI